MRRDDQRLADIVEAPDWIAKAISGKTEPDFLADETLCYAIAQRLATIGEAMYRLSPEVKARDGSVPWQAEAEHHPATDGVLAIRNFIRAIEGKLATL